MNISKRWKKFLLSTAAFFWAGCGGDSESIAPENEDIHSTQTGDSLLIGGGAIALYGVQPVFDPDSGKITSSDSCGDSCHVESSSSESGSSDSGNKPFRLARDTSITCTFTTNGGECLDAEDNRRDAEARKKMLAENQTRTLEQLDSLEDEKGEPFDDWFAPEYGVPSTSCVHVALDWVYKCTDNRTYRSLYADSDNLLYTKEEYKAKYPEKFQSSSSAEPESSSSVPPPSPLCQKDDFATSSDMAEAFEKDKEALLDSTKNANGDNLSGADSSCLADVHISRSYASVSVLAKKQICDGDTIVNPRYQEKIDAHKEFIEKQIKNCMEKPEQDEP